MFFAVVCLLTGKNVCAQKDRYTAKSVFTSYRAAIVQVIASQTFKGGVLKSTGTGFVVSSNGVILTANHVVSPAGLQGYLTDIEIKLSDGRLVKASPVVKAPSDESKFHDYAILRTAEDLKLTSLKLGTWKEVTEGDQLTTLGYALNLPGPVLLTVTAAGCFPIESRDVVTFQGPNNRGLSGAPLVSNRTGNVVGIVTSRLVGISDKLEDIRKGAAIAAGSIRLSGVDPNAAILELTNVLDAYLMSGMGAAIAIDYAKTSVSAQ